MKGMITRIQRFTVHDGPGIRTMVFLKGCPLRCAWCSNPETQAFFPEPAHNPDLCRADCALCATACPHGAIRMEGGLTFDRALCSACQSFACAAACPWGALEIYGESKGVEEILDLVEEDLAFYRHEGGGLTLSGGEALASPDFALALLAEARERHLHTAVESCGHISPAALDKACTLTDYLIFDIKHADAARHRQGTGQDNGLILGNLARALASGLTVHVRTPLIAGFNADAASVTAMGRLLADMGAARWELLPGHNYGQGKYTRLGRALPPPCEPAPELVEELRTLARAFVPDTPAGIPR